MSSYPQFRLTSNRGQVNLFAGICSTNGTGALTNEANTARATVARTAVGKITVTFPIWYAQAYGYDAQYHQGTPNGTYAQVDSFNLNSSGYGVMVIGTYTSGNVATDTTGTLTWETHVRK
jgi:hypothetical protein